jgi:hypothetical protein
MVFENFPWYVWAFTLFGVVGMPLATAIVLRRVGLGFAALWTVWIGLSWALAEHGAYLADPREPRLGLPLALFGSFVVLLSATRIPAVQRILAEPSMPARLAWPQMFRVVGGVFLVVMGLGGLPMAFALPAGLGDVAIGFAAPFVARGASRSRLIWFNIFGILDLVVAVTVGFLAGQGPLQVLHVAPSTLALTELPLALIPTTGVSLALALHVTSLRLLRR